MITAPDFEKKQIIFVLSNEGEKLGIRNDNLVVTDAEGKIKLQCTCYRLFLINIIGNCSLTSVLIQKAKKYGFYIALYTSGFHLFQVIGSAKEGNTLLKRKQYGYDSLELAKHIVKNKIASQYQTIHSFRIKGEIENEALDDLKHYCDEIDFSNDNNSLLAYEGLAAKTYFSVMFNEIEWTGRRPRVKKDIINASLDIGYTMLFNYIDAILESFGFDTYVGIYHKEFYMRKSLVCDLMEPFRVLIDKTIKRSYNLGQIKVDDFEFVNNQYRLKWKMNTKYISFLMKPILDNKDLMFKYIQSYYRCFMKGLDAKEYPVYLEGEVTNGFHKL